APRAAEALKFTSRDLLRFGIIDDIVPEPLGGAHRNHREAAASLKGFLIRSLRELIDLPREQLLDRRYAKYRKIRVFLPGDPPPPPAGPGPKRRGLPHPPRPRPPPGHRGHSPLTILRGGGETPPACCLSRSPVRSSTGPDPRRLRPPPCPRGPVEAKNGSTPE